MAKKEQKEKQVDRRAMLDTVMAIARARPGDVRNALDKALSTDMLIDTVKRLISPEQKEMLDGHKSAVLDVWPKDKKLPSKYKRTGHGIAAYTPCMKCLRVIVPNTLSPAVVLKAVNYSIAYLECRVCGHSFQLEIEDANDPTERKEKRTDGLRRSNPKDRATLTEKQKEEIEKRVSKQHKRTEKYKAGTFVKLNKDDETRSARERADEERRRAVLNRQDTLIRRQKP